MSQRPLPDRSVYEIIRACQEEARQTRSQEKGYCYELFRRAIEEQDDAAWTAIEQQYNRLILSWVLNRSPGMASEDAEAAAQEALSKFWRTLTRRSEPIAERFNHVGGLLGYLKQCAVTSLIDRQRQAQRQTRLQERLQQTARGALFQSGPQESTVAQLAREERLQQIRNWIASQVTDPQERLILRLTYEEELTPAQIASGYPQVFPDAHTVRRVKERVLKRARRALAA